MSEGEFDGWLITTMILSFLMSFSIGSNDAANGLATSYGSKAASLRKLVIMGAIAEFIGAYFCADALADKLASNIIPHLNEKEEVDDALKKRMMMAVCLASFIFIMMSSVAGIPISGTHTIIGSLMGAGIVTTGFMNVNWHRLGKIAMFWVISPTLSAFIAFLIMMMLSALTMNTSGTSFHFRIYMMQLVSSLCFIVIAIILGVLTVEPPIWTLVLAGFVFG